MDELSAFHQFYDDMIHGICIVRSDGTDAIVYANKRMLAMYDCQTEKKFLALAEEHVQGLFFEGDDQLDWQSIFPQGNNRKRQRSSVVISMASRKRMTGMAISLVII